MSKPLKPRRGTTAQNNAEIGEAYEITYDIDKNTIVCRDGKTPGGFPLAREAEVGTIREDTIAAAQLAAGITQGESGSLTLEGVAAEVGLKANASLDNLSAAGRSLAAGLGMPSGRYVDLTLGASGTTYTAPANGWVALSKRATASFQTISITCNGIQALEWSCGADLNLFVHLPVKKGDNYSVVFSASGVLNYFRFIYAEGEEA